MPRKILTVALALFAASTIVWACIATARANPRADFVSIASEFQLFLLPLGMHLVFSKGVEYPGRSRYTVLGVGLFMWAAVLYMPMGGLVCNAEGPALQRFALMALVFPGMLIAKTFQHPSPPLPPRAPENRVVWAR